MTDDTPDVRHPIERQPGDGAAATITDIERQRQAATVPVGAPVIVGGVTLQELPDGRLQIISPLAGLVVTTWEHFLANLSNEHAATTRAVVAASANAQEQLEEHAARLQRPAWADQASYSPDRGNEGAAVYRWTAPLPEGLLSNTEGCGEPLGIELVQHRLLTLVDAGVTVEDEPPAVHFEAGDAWLSPVDAMAVAAALVACAVRPTPLADGGPVRTVAAADDDQRVVVVADGSPVPLAWWLPGGDVMVLQPGTAAETAAALRQAADRLDAAS